MNTEALFLFLILLLGLVLCSFLGGNCGKEGYTNSKDNKNHIGNDNMHPSMHNPDMHNPDMHDPNMHNPNMHNPNMHDPDMHNPDMHNPDMHDPDMHNPDMNNQESKHHYDNYNHYSKSSSPITNGKMYYGSNGETATISTNSSGMQMIHLIQGKSSSPIMFSQTAANSKTFNGPSGFSAMISKLNNETNITFIYPNGTTEKFTPNMPSTFTSSEYFGSTGSTIQMYPYHGAYQNNGSPSPSSHMSYSGPYSSPSHSSPSSSSSSSSPSPSSMFSHPSQTQGSSNYDYSSSLPQGIPASQIPPGQEDMYILKSEVVPPVCPACPTSSACPRQEKCPPCPACARCPESSFECKKVPNYNAINEDYLPQPVVNDFSQFGM